MFFGYCIAVFISSAVAIFPFALLGVNIGRHLDMFLALYPFAMIFACFYVALYSCIPSALVIALCEWQSARHPRIYVISGALISFCAHALMALLYGEGVFYTSFVISSAMAGAAAGYVYWKFAGHNAGLPHGADRETSASRPNLWTIDPR